MLIHDVMYSVKLQLFAFKSILVEFTAYVNRDSTFFLNQEIFFEPYEF